MKLRTDFVTNSSSSSFIVAKTDACTYQEVRDLLGGLENEAAKSLRAFWLDASKESVECFLNHLADMLFSGHHILKLGDWYIHVESFSGDITSQEFFMHHWGDRLDSEHFKVRDGSS